jgi:hypothetical protein
MRIGYMNWTQEKFYVTLMEKYQKGLQISKRVTDIKSTNWTQSPVD